MSFDTFLVETRAVPRTETRTEPRFETRTDKMGRRW